MNMWVRLTLPACISRQTRWTRGGGAATQLPKHPMPVLMRNSSWGTTCMGAHTRPGMLQAQQPHRRLPGACFCILLLPCG